MKTEKIYTRLTVTEFVFLILAILATPVGLAQSGAASSTAGTVSLVPQVSRESQVSQTSQSPDGRKVILPTGRLHYVIVTGESAYISCTQDEYAHAQSLRKAIPQDFIWLAQRGKSYVIRDEGTVRQVQKWLAPDDAIAQEQSELRKKRTLLDEGQADLEKKESLVRVDVADVTPTFSKMEAEFSRLRPSASQQDLSRVREELAGLQDALAQLQSRAGEEQSKLAGQRSAIAQEQTEISERQSILAREQAQRQEKGLARVEDLFRQAITSRIAKLE